MFAIILSLSQLFIINYSFLFIQEPTEIGDKNSSLTYYNTEVWNGTPVMSKQHLQNMDHLTMKKPGMGRRVTSHLPSNKNLLLQPF